MGNLISGNSGNGIDLININSSFPLSDNQVLGNSIGVGNSVANGPATIKFGNTKDGILLAPQNNLSGGLLRNTIGGSAAGTRNIIGGNATGIEINGNGGGTGANANPIYGNKIGYNNSGAALFNLGNTGDGIEVDNSGISGSSSAGRGPARETPSRRTAPASRSPRRTPTRPSLKPPSRTT